MKRPWALPLVPVYLAGLKVDRALTRERRLRWPVISVGSLSAGGAGKTPVVKMLAELLGRHGAGVDVLSRGYGRSSRLVEQVTPRGGAERYGDEPLEMAREGLRVFVGNDRFRAGLLAEAGKEAQIHLLDDGFQHRALARDLDVVLLTLADVADWLLPAGNLREPLSALKRADVVVVRKDEEIELRSLGDLVGGKACWVVRRKLNLSDNVPWRRLAFCGVGRPENFFEMLREAGCEMADTMCFPDHHTYSERDVTALLVRAKNCGAAGFVTTAKDLVKLTEEMQTRLGAVTPVLVGELRVSLVDEAGAVRLLQPLLEQIWEPGSVRR